MREVNGFKNNIGKIFYRNKPFYFNSWKDLQIYLKCGYSTIRGIKNGTLKEYEGFPIEYDIVKYYHADKVGEKYYCHYCGTEIKKNQENCGHCGDTILWD